MDILFKTTRLQSDCNDSKRAVKAYGADVAKRLRQRLDELRAAATLDVMWTLPQARCEELKADRKGQLSVRLPGALRLIFEPAHDPVPKRGDGGLDRAQVTAIRILEIEDYHG